MLITILVLLWKEFESLKNSQKVSLNLDKRCVLLVSEGRGLVYQLLDRVKVALESIAVT